MPAINLTTLPAEGSYDAATQLALFKLWLIFTTNTFLVNEATTVCQSTVEAALFIARTAHLTAPVYYLDLEELSRSLAPITLPQIQAASAKFKPASEGGALETLTAAYSQFYGLGGAINSYGHVYCASIPEILGS